MGRDLLLSALIEATLRAARGHRRRSFPFVKLLCFGRRRPKKCGSETDPIRPGEPGARFRCASIHNQPDGLA